MGRKYDRKKTRQRNDRRIQDDSTRPLTRLVHFSDGDAQPEGTVSPFPIAYDNRLGHV